MHHRCLKNSRPNYRSLSQERSVIRTRLAQTFRYIISQRLIPRADGRGRIAVAEVLRSSPRTREYIETGETDGKSLLDAMRDGKLDGMQGLRFGDKAVDRRQVISLEDGLNFATNQNNLLLSLKGLTSRKNSFGVIPSTRRLAPLLIPARCWECSIKIQEKKTMIVVCPNCSLRLQPVAINHSSIPSLCAARSATTP